MPAGVYAITHTPTGRLYIGSSVNVPRRWSSHRRDLRRGTHPNRFLQAAWVKYGEDAFEFTVIEQCPPERLVEREQAWLDTLRSFDRSVGFNLSPSAYSLRGFRFTAEQRARVSSALKGRPKSAEHRANLWANREPNLDQFADMGRSGKGRPKSARHRKRIGERQRGSMNHGAKLDEAAVMAIRSRLAAGEKGRHLASEYGVHESVISEIKSGLRWTHVPHPSPQPDPRSGSHP